MIPVLSGMTLDEMITYFAFRNPPLPPYRARQVFARIAKGAETFDAMSELPLVMRRELKENCAIRSTQLDAIYTAPDGTVKIRVRTEDGLAVESVILHDGRGRRTSCLSSQAGCPVGCLFCATGKLGFSRNLTAGEIVEQAYHINKHLAEEEAPPPDNIVFMGMGEPMLNLEAVRKACALLCGEDGGACAFSPRRVTVSTCGLPEKIRDFTANGPDVRLAVSITTALEGLRRRLMPAAGSAAEVKDALMDYQKQRGRRVTLALTLLGGLTTTSECAAALAAFADGLDVMINLIPWNAVPADSGGQVLQFEGKPFCPPAKTETDTFRRELERFGLKAVLRRNKGGAIAGACGQLGGAAANAPL